MKCPSCGAYSLTYDRRLHAFICHIYGRYQGLIR
ncbi:hypothetical protein SEA_PHREAK_52 [Mycobacterium phage Phreak]|nr:hypothetical protein SEA_PHREAK_52 [Mycobacterium phage Phreak]